MENLESQISSEKQPQMVDLFSPEIETKIKDEGQTYQRKIEAIQKPEQVVEPRIVETRLPDGTLESIVEAKQGDWIITGAKGETFVLSVKKFNDLYRTDDNGGYIPKDRRVIALKNPFDEAVKILAPWGTSENPAYQEGSAECFFVVTLDESQKLTGNRYIIGDEELLLSNYDPIDEK